MNGLDTFLDALENFNSNWILLVVDVVLEVSDRDGSAYGYETLCLLSSFSSSKSPYFV